MVGIGEAPVTKPSAGPSQRPFGQPPVPLSQLDDAALMAEVRRRRQRRGQGTPATGTVDQLGSSPQQDAGSASSAVQPLTPQARQWLANLELGTGGATLTEVEAAYERLVQRYGPALEAPSPERRAAAKALLASLKKAHDGLRLWLSRARS